MTRCWSANAAERPSMTEVVRIMSHMFQFFKGADEPLIYINGASDADAYNPAPLSTMGGWSQASANESPITGESRGGTISKTIRHAAGEPVPILPVMQTPQIYNPPVVLEDDSPRSGVSCPPSLAASLENLDRHSPRSGTPVNPFKRHSTDLSILDEYDTVGQGGVPPKNLTPVKGHRRSGSYGTPGMYTPVNHSLAPPTHGRLNPGKTHNRTGSDEYRRITPGDTTPRTASPSPSRTVTPAAKPARLPHVQSYPRIGHGLAGSTMTTGPIQATEPSLNGQQLTAANRSISWTPGNPAGPVVNGLPGNTADINAMNMVYVSLEHQLQPLEPAQNNEESQEIFRQHCQLAEQYLKVQTEIALLMQRKHELIKEYERGEKRGEPNSVQIASEYFQLHTENESLTTLHKSLKKQVDQIRRLQQHRRIAT